ncbi:hypothetical protein GGI07_005672 [Coemansia sp. Benny D115]|nr:hypothetical protein GGI07_005672 [Coemansia sp. Benny D115]
MHKLSAQSTRLYEFLSTFPDLEDDDRRAFLCSDLQATEAQEEAYEFWTQLLQRATESGLLGTTRLSIHVERAADRLTEWHYANVTCGLMDNLMDLDEFRHRFAHVLGTSEDTEPLECLDLGDARVLVKRLTDCRVVATAPLVASGTSDNKTLESMERVEWRLQQSNSDIQMVEALRVGALALRGMNERVEVTDVEKVLEEWVEEEAQAAQVEEALRDGWTVGRQEDMEDDEEELEAELAELIEDSKKSRAGVNVQDIDSKSVNNKSVDVLADALGQVDISPSRAEDKKNKEEEEEEESDDEQVAIPA